MTLRSILSVDVDDSRFKQFQTLFDKYQAQLAKTPAAWGKVSKENQAVAGQFQKMTAALMAQSTLNREQAESGKNQVKTLSQSERLWISMSRSTKDVSKNIGSATTSLLRWTGVLGGVSGLLGAGGLFGIDRMAAGG